MIEKMFPQTVSNILDYTAIKEAAKKYVEETFVQIVESFGKNLVLQSMDAEHLAEVAKNVSGNPNMTVDELLDYINTNNVYHEFEFVDELMAQFPEGVEYKEFEVTGWGFPESDIFPFNQEYRSFDFDGQPRGDQDFDWSRTWDSEQRLLASRFGKQMVRQGSWWNWDIKRTSGRRASWGNSETWMTTGGFGKPATIHINVDEERTVIEENGLTTVENWLGTVSNKLPVNLYIEINDNLSTTQTWSGNQIEGLAGSTNGYKYSFPYYEEENFCTNDPNWEKEEYYVEEPQTENYPVIFWIDTKMEYNDGWVCRKQIYTTDGRMMPLTDEYKPYLNKQLLSDISGIPVADLNDNFWSFLMNNGDIVIGHRAVQINSTGGQPPVIATWINSLENSDSENIGFMFTDGRIYIAEDNTDFSSHIFEDIHYGDDGWIAITDYNPQRSHGFTMVRWPNYGISSPFLPLKYLIRNSIECTSEYTNNIIEVSALHLEADEEGLAYPSLADYLVANYFGATFAIMMPSIWFNVRKKYDNKDNPIPLN